MILVTTPTGQIGSQLVGQLLAADETVRVLVRDPAKLSPEVQEKVDIVQGSSDKEDVLMRALAGVESVFHVVPPSFLTKDNNERYLQFTRPVCRAMKANGTERVVSVSGMGRGVAVNAGPVTASFLKDAEFESTGVNFRALWCPGFMENMLRQVGPLKEQGMFFLPSNPDLKAPLVATRDIASSAAKLLLDRSWTGQGGLAVLGPEDLSLNEMAEILSEVLGKSIRYQQISGEAYKAHLVKLGATEEMAQSLVDMFAAKDNDLDRSERRTPENTTPTTFRQWCEEVLKPALNN